MNFSNYIKSCNHYYNQVTEQFHDPKKFPSAHLYSSKTCGLKASTDLLCVTLLFVFDLST